MARTIKNTATYFPHYADASNSDTLTVLQSKYGNDGYAFWFKLLEKLTGTENHCLDLSNPNKWQVFVAKLGLDEITIVEMLNLLVEMQAIDKELWASKLIWCQNLVDNLADVYKNRRREIPQKPISTCSNGITTCSNSNDTIGCKITTMNIPQSKEEESRINKKEIVKKDTTSLEKKIDKLVNDLRPEFNDLDIDMEVRKFKVYWLEGIKKLKNPKLALLNWFTKAREYSNNGGNNGKYKEGDKWTGLAGNKPTGVFKDVLE